MTPASRQSNTLVRKLSYHGSFFSVTSLLCCATSRTLYTVSVCMRSRYSTFHRSVIWYTVSPRSYRCTNTLSRYTTLSLCCEYMRTVSVLLTIISRSTVLQPPNNKASPNIAYTMIIPPVNSIRNCLITCLCSLLILIIFEKSLYPHGLRGEKN